MTADTIVAVSSGRPPAAIAVLRVSGPRAISAVSALAGRLPPPRRAGLRALHDMDGALLDRALVLVFPGPNSATGEDLVEVHCHGGRAVVAAVERVLLDQRGVRAAEAGEFTRRGLLNGRIDLAQAEGLADLLAAETEAQRRAAIQASDGQVSRAVRGWMDRIAMIAARVEASLDFAEEGDLGAEAELLRSSQADAARLKEEMSAVLAHPPVERLRDGIRVVISGPPNSGKSTLLNLLAMRDAAIVSPHSGTTRDRIEVPVSRDGVAWLLTDTAGLNNAADPVERIGVALAVDALAAADIVLWLGDEQPARADALWIHSRADAPGRATLPPGRSIATRQDDGTTIDMLWRLLTERARSLLPSEDALALNRRQRSACEAATTCLTLHEDALVVAEQLRMAMRALGNVLGLDATETMMDALFTRFCLGK